MTDPSHDRPVPVVRVLGVSLPAGPSWPKGLRVDLVVGRRRRVRRMVSLLGCPEGAHWVRLGLGPVRCAVRIGPCC